MMPLMLVATTLTATVVATGSILFGGRWWGYYPAVLWSKVMAWLSLVTVTVKGRENINKKTSYVFVANHQGAYDIFAIYGWLGHNFKWMMKKGLRSIPMVGFACYKAGHIYVDNSTRAAIHKTMVNAEKQLADGTSLVVFPEGTRTKSGQVGVFKKGAYALAVEFNLPVVPITIDGAYHIMPITSRLPRPGHITLTIHKPILPKTGGHDTAALIKESRDAVVSALKEQQ